MENFNDEFFFVNRCLFHSLHEILSRASTAAAAVYGSRMAVNDLE